MGEPEASITNKAANYRAQGNVYGPASILHFLALLRCAQQTDGEAHPLLERTLAGAEQVLGADHPDTADMRYNLAFFYQAQQAYELAFPHYNRALTIYTSVLGSNHPTTCACRNHRRSCLVGARLGPLPDVDTREERISQVLAQVRAVFDVALIDPAVNRRALATAIEARARWVEEDEVEGSPYLVLAAELRTLIAQLGVEPDDPDALGDGA